MIYTKIHTKIWNDEKVKQLSINEKQVFFYLLTNKNVNTLGLYELPIVVICHHLKLSEKEVRHCLNTLSKLYITQYYELEEVVYITNFLKYNNFQNLSQLTGTITSVIPNLPMKALPEKLVNHLVTEYERYESIEQEKEEDKRSHKNIEQLKKIRGYINNININSNINININIKECRDTPETLSDTVSRQCSILEKQQDKTADLKQAIINEWNTFASKMGLSQIIKLTKERKTKLSLRIKEGLNLDSMKKILWTLNNNSFYLGDNDRKWRPDFDYIIKNENCWVKLVEYANNPDWRKHPNYDMIEKIKKYGMTDTIAEMRNYLHKEIPETERADAVLRWFEQAKTKGAK